MDAVIGWIVIAGVVLLAWRAIRKWRREFKQGLTAAVSAADAAATAVAHADAGGVHLHMHAAGDVLGDERSYIDVGRSDGRAEEIASLVARLTELSAVNDSPASFRLAADQPDGVVAIPRRAEG